MLNANNKVNYEPSIKQKEKKHSLSTVLARLYLKTIGRMLPGRWNKWAENILYYNIADNGVQTDDLLNSDREKELKDENERLKEKLKEMNELTEQVKSLGEEKEIFAKFFAEQAQQIEDLELENEELKSKLAGLKKNYSELVEIAQKRGEEFLAQFKEKSEEILHLQKELIECSKEFANKTETLSVRVEEKDGKIVSLTELNEVLEQEKKEMENKNNAQQQIILDQEEKIDKQGALITSLTDKNKDINETVKEDNESLRAQNTDLESKVSQLKDESDTKIKELKNQLEEKQAELEQAKKKNTEVEDLTRELKSAQKQLVQKNTDLTNQLQDLSSKLHAAEKNKKELEDEVKELKEQAKKKGAELQNLKQQLEKEKIDFEDKLKDSSSKLIEKKELDSKIATLQKQVERLSQEREKATSIAISSVENNVETLSETLKNQQIESSIAEDGPQELKEKSNNVDTKLEGIDEKTKEQAKAKALDTVSITKSTTKSTLSKLRNFPNKIFRDKSLDNFLSDQNAKLKEGFPEFKREHFCHKVLGETIKSLSNQSDGKFESNKLLELLESNLKNLAREIIEDLVKKVVTRAFEQDVKKNSVIQVSSVQKCAKELYLNEEDSKAILNSFTGFLANRNDSNNDSVKEFIVKELIEAKMKCFLDKIKGLQLASSIRYKFLCSDEKMCVQTSEENNEYRLTEKAKKEYKLTLPLTPNSSMSHTTTSNIQGLARSLK